MSEAGRFEKGVSGNPEGINGRPFQRALKMEIAAAGEDHKALRQIARNLINLAQQNELAALPAINSVADRLDGKPAQTHQGTEDGPAIKHAHEVTVTVIEAKPRGSESI